MESKKRRDRTSTAPASEPTRRKPAGPPEATGADAPDREPSRLATAVHAAADIATTAAEKVTAVTTDSVHAAAGKVGDLAESIESVGDAVSSKARPVIADVAHDVSAAAKGARRRVRDRSARRRSASLARARLPHLYQVHPEARLAAPRERGLQLVPVEEIAGTTVSSTARGKDFLPIGPARTPGWQTRWQRILKGVDGLVALPPVDLVRYGGRYWVVDGHNRIAAARRVGQVAVDANVIDLVGAGPADPATPIAAYLDESTDLRAVGSGRRLHRHAEGEGGGGHA